MLDIQSLKRQLENHVVNQHVFARHDKDGQFFSLTVNAALGSGTIRYTVKVPGFSVQVLELDRALELIEKHGRW